MNFRRWQAHISVEEGEGGCHLLCQAKACRGGGWYERQMPMWLVLVLAVIARVGVLLWRWVSGSPHAGVRAQAWQMVQVVQVLWPPFVLMARRRASVRLVRRQWERFRTRGELL